MITQSTAVVTVTRQIKKTHNLTKTGLHRYNKLLTTRGDDGVGCGRTTSHPHPFHAQAPPPHRPNINKRLGSKITQLSGRNVVAIDLQSTYVRKIKLFPCSFDLQDTLLFVGRFQKQKSCCAIGYACLAVTHDVHPNLAKVHGLVAFLEGDLLRILQ